MPVTIRDVAKAAGVSITTVSRALNGNDDVGAQTRQRVIAVAKDLNYRPSHVARSLVLQQTRNIGLVVSDFHKDRGGHHFMFDVLLGVHEKLAEYEYDVTFVSTSTARQRLVSYMDFCTERRLEGVIVMGIRLDDPYMHEVVESSLPSVVIDIPLLSDHCGYVMTDNVNGAKYAVLHLLQKGHTSIGFVNGHEQAAVSVDRQRGFEAAMHSAGLPANSVNIYHSDFTLEGGKRGMAALLEQMPDLTAVFFASDLMAIGGMQYAKEIGKRVPDDIAVVGFDNIDLSEFIAPALTTVAQRRFAMGTTAVDILIDMLQHRTPPTGRLLAPELIVRSST